MTNSSEGYWICKGTKEDPHPEYEVEAGQNCDICGQNSKSAKSKNKPALPLGVIAGAIALMLLGGLGIWWFSRPKTITDNSQTQQNQPIDTSNINDANSNPSPLDYSWQPDRFTKGQRTLFSGESNPNRDKGIKAFRQEDYGAAVSAFQRAKNANRNDPEVVILYNNAKARQQGNPLTLAAVVPVENNMDSAKQILRGIAQAQQQFNTNGGVGGRLLEIVIANDGNRADNAIQVARQLMDDESILGVIGHNSSSATKAGLSVYVQSGLAVVSPTSSSNDLKDRSFYRTLPSDSATGEKLAQYVQNSLNLSRVVVFYTSDSSYSNSLTSAFESSFAGTITKKVDISDSNPNFNPGIEVSSSVFQDQAQAALLFPSTKYVSVATELARANYSLPPDQRLKLLGGDALYQGKILTAGGEAVENLTLAVPWFAKSPRSQNFTSSCEKQWGGTVNWRTAMSYDATQALIKTFDANSDRAAVFSKLKQINVPANETSGQALQFSSGERSGEPVLVKATRGGVASPSGSDFGFELVSE
ncbi:MAG: ABC transporter substrate-binding protein [Cyanobacteria bacterium J06600_6]